MQLVLSHTSGWRNNVEFGCLHCGVVELTAHDDEDLYLWRKCPMCGEKTAFSIVLAVDTINSYLREPPDDE